MILTVVLYILGDNFHLSQSVCLLVKILVLNDFFFLIWFRSWLLVSAQTNIHAEYLTELRALARESSQLLLLEQCLQGNYSVRCSSGAGRDMFMYPQVLYKTL